MMATRARPLPIDPYNPIASDGGVVRHPSPFVPLRLPIFAVVIWLNDSIVKLLSVGTSAGSYTNKAGDVHSKRGGKGDAEGIENIEEGGNVDIVLEPLGIPLTSGFDEPSGRRRVKLSRKKLD
jgi:etoposide-induced 2.4 mRNA